MSLPQIGKLFKRDHTTVLSSIKTIEREISANPSIDIEISELTREIKGWNNVPDVKFWVCDSISSVWHRVLYSFSTGCLKGCGNFNLCAAFFQLPNVNTTCWNVFLQALDNRFLTEFPSGFSTDNDSCGFIQFLQTSPGRRSALNRKIHIVTEKNPHSSTGRIVCFGCPHECTWRST